MKYILTTILLVSVFGINVSAQKSITIGTDPVTIAALNGIEIEGGFSFKKNRITLSLLRSELTPWFDQRDDFEDARHAVVEIGYSRWLKEDQKGFNFGLSYAYFARFRVENSVGEKLTKNPSRLGVRLAYAWFPLKKVNIFIEPALNLGFLIDDDDLNFANGETFNSKSFIGNGPVLNIGYRFNLK